MADDQLVTAVAQGVVMCRYRISRHDALALLHQMAAESGTPVADVAAGLLDQHDRTVRTDRHDALAVARPPGPVRHS